MKHSVLIAIAWLLGSFTTLVYGQSVQTVSSPDKHLRLVVSTKATGELTYALTFRGQPVILPSALGFTFSKPAVSLNRFTLVSADSSTVDESWKPVWGEVAQIRNHYTQLVVRVTGMEASGVRASNIQMILRFRVFNDGIGFRYEFPTQPNLQHFVVADEGTQFRLAADHRTFWIPGDYDTNEYLYNTTKLSEISALTAAAKEKDIALQALIGPNTVQTPLLLKTANGLYISLYEAALLNYPALHLQLDKTRLTLRTQLVPDAVGNKAYLQTPAQTPWRTIIVSNKATDLLASKLILNLNEPSKIADPSWIKPQKFVGMWWEMHVGKANWPLAGGKHGANTANVKTYIDFAAQYGFDGVLVEGWNEGWEDWFGNWKEDVFDFVTPYRDYDIDGLTTYARQKGVKLIMHHETSGSVTNYERRMDAALQFMNAKDINTVKTGYVGRIIPRGEHHDGQWMVKHYERVVEKAAQYKIMVDSHESVHPTGLHRTYPNWLASEAARGSEFNNAPTLGITPEHTTILPFTRLLGGPMDFTPGLFRLRLNQFDSTRTQRVRTTLAKQLALFVTIYSPLQMAADLPENYQKHLDSFQFIRDVPVDWDDTRVLAAEPGDYVAIARKGKGSGDWFLGAITDENSRTMPISLDFLEAGKTYEATLYRDADNADWQTNPEAYTIDKQRVTNSITLSLRLAKGGGCAIRLRRL